MNHNEPAAIESSGTTETVSLRAYAKLENELKSVEEDLSRLAADYGNYRKAMSKKLDSLKKELEEVRERGSSGQNPKGEDGENGGAGSKSENTREMLPIERLQQMKNEDENHPALPKNGRESFDRAVSIYENFEKWSKKTPKGLTITSGLKTLLETVTGERLAWRQVYRAMDKIEEWTNGVITHERTKRHGHVLVAKERPSSARRGG